VDKNCALAKRRLILYCNCNRTLEISPVDEKKKKNESRKGKAGARARTLYTHVKLAGARRMYNSTKYVRQYDTILCRTVARRRMRARERRRGPAAASTAFCGVARRRARAARKGRQKSSGRYVGHIHVGWWRRRRRWWAPYFNTGVVVVATAAA